MRLWLRQPKLARKHAVEVLQVVQQCKFPIWSALGTCLLGIADAELARAEEEQITGLEYNRTYVAHYSNVITRLIKRLIFQLAMLADGVLQSWQQY